METTPQNDTGRIVKLLLKHARDAFLDDSRIDSQWQSLNYTERPDLNKAITEYAAFTAFLKNAGAELHFMPPGDDTGLDSIYVRDAVVAAQSGIILCRMGKAVRRGEAAAQAAYYRKIGIPILGTIEAPGTLEGGDVAWLDKRTVAVGRGYRTNDAGIRQLRALLGDSIDELIEVALPHFRGPEDVFHLMSIFSPVDRDLAVVYSPLMPVPFRETLLQRGYRLVEVPEAEYDSMGCNVLAMAPSECLMLEGNPQTRDALLAAGCTVHEYQGNEISRKGCGGPTCLTRPLLRVDE